MRLVKSNTSGELLKSEKLHFGGEYSFLDKWRSGGTGSNKLVYISGIELLDLLRRDVEGEMIFVSFEVLKNGLILRANCNQRLINLGMRKSDLKVIKLVGYRIQLDNGNVMPFQNPIVHRGDLEIISKNKSEAVKFSIVTREYNDIIPFFQSKGLSQYFNHTISRNPPELEDITLYKAILNFL